MDTEKIRYRGSCPSHQHHQHLDKFQGSASLDVRGFQSTVKLRGSPGWQDHTVANMPHGTIFFWRISSFPNKKCQPKNPSLKAFLRKQRQHPWRKKRKTPWDLCEVDPELQAAIDAAKEAQAAAAKAGSVFGKTQRHLFFNNLGCPPSQ